MTLRLRLAALLALALVAAIPTLGEEPTLLNIVGALVVTAGILATVFLQPRRADPS